MNTYEQKLDFLQQYVESITSQTKDSKILEGTEIFKKRLKTVKNKEFMALQLSVLKNLGTITPTPFTFNFHQISIEMVWKPSPRTDENGQKMALCTINDMLGLVDLVVGLLLVDKHERYPPHQHSPQELYLVLSGEADWR